jgi:hypothetical protein
MRAREAKDFLVQQIAEQAQLDSVPLSDLEKRMMYFTESGEMPEDPIQLNDEFEAQYDTKQYEAKIAKLLHRAYQRARKENDETRKRFDTAIKTLRRGDHYLLVMWDSRPGLRLPNLIGVGIAAIFIGGLYAISWLGRRVTPPNPQIIQAILVALILFGLLFQRATAKAVGWIFENTLGRLLGREKSESD